MTVSHILTLLSANSLVTNVIVVEINIEPKTQSLRVKAALKKDFVLHINESIGESYRRYSYHLQKDNKMILRWDNAPHWKEIKTFPFHLHVPDRERPIECNEVFIDDVFLEIRDILCE
ncbi:MAG TPA: hypothetical protein DD719_00335 [Desulfotomaculum sp.]|nr:hypothetical protein [Desulfotomaculum sp.]